MAAPGWNAAWDAQEFEFIELRNFGTQPINLSGVKFTTGISFQFPSPGGPILSPGQSIVLVKNQTAFEIRYGAGINIGGTFTGSLNNGGEQLTLRTGSDVLIRDITYDNSGAWPGRADGKGSTLEIVSPTADGNLAGSWRNSIEYNGTPGAAGIGSINSIVVNEVLTHTDPPMVDAVEFHNPTGASIDLSGWYLSDDADNYQKYRIPNGTVIPAGGYLVLDESHFNPTPGVDPSFSFNSATGDDVYLVSANPAGKLLNFIDHVDFPAAANGESFGRWPNATGKLYPMVSRTLGAANSGPRIGPVVISEIMYNHPSFNDDLEYVELLNITDNPINLTNWKFDRGIDMTFGNVTIQPRSTLVVVRFDPNDPLNATKVNDFRTAYGISAAIPLAGGYAGLLNGGVLDNGGETIRLARPDAPEPDMTIPYLLVDEVEYDDVAPWPTTPDGTGPSLTRTNTQTVYGHEPTNWSGASATPGTLPLPAAATNLTANATAANRVHLAWLDPAVNETGFKIERSTDGANFIVVATLGANATSYDDVNLQSSLGYFYRVRSFNDAGNGGASNTAQVTTPQLVTITGAGGP